MQPETIPDRPPVRPPGGVIVAAGYGLKIYVNRGHLIVHDGVGRNRRTLRFHRALSKLKRVIVVGHDGYITLEATRWIRDVGATLVQIDRDGTLVAITTEARHHESKLRRAQVLATDNETGRIATVDLLRAKLEHQARNAERLAPIKEMIRPAKGPPVTIASAIRGYAARMQPDLEFDRLRVLESSAGRNYWQAWALVPLKYDPAWTRTVPDHWHFAGPRTSAAEEKKRARKATTPAHAILNYTYAILETEAIIAAHKLGFDPSLGVMHADKRYRGSLASDLMEPGRPAADALVLDLLEARQLRRGDVYETREGGVRVGPSLVRELGAFHSSLRASVAPHAEQLARTLMRSQDHPTPLTRQRHVAALSRSGR